ncbi:MAG: hypothetical protein ABMA13_04510 [Chthoniobacteraceae bacterium]
MFLFLLVLPACAFAQTPAPALVRTWTTTEGKTFQAALQSFQGTQVTLRLANGQLAAIAIARLSPADQDFIKGGANAVATRPPVEKRIWPQKVEVDTRAIEVKTVSEDPGQQKCVYRSQNFEFITQDKIAGSVLKEIARTFEATRSLVQALPWAIEPKPPEDLGFYRAKFYVSRANYIADGGPEKSGGVYFSKDRIFRVPFQSLGLELRGKTWFKDANYRNDTIVHEITHQMMHDFLPFLPTWATEGTAEYAEMLPFNAGVFTAGSHERGMKEYIKEFAARGIKPAGLVSALDHMSMTNEQWHKQSEVGGDAQGRLYFSSCLLVYYFCHLDGDGKGTRFLKYLDKMAEARDAWSKFFADPRVTRNDDGSFTYRGIGLPPYSRKGDYGLDQLGILLEGRSADDLQKAVVEGYKKIGVRW